MARFSLINQLFCSKLESVMTPDLMVACLIFVMDKYVPMQLFYCLDIVGQIDLCSDFHTCVYDGYNLSLLYRFFFLTLCGLKFVALFSMYRVNLSNLIFEINSF